MWIFINDSFFSIVQDSTNEDNLLVRARFPKDIKNVFPEAITAKTPDRDYLYRTSLPRKLVEDSIASEIARINYPNFKDSVEDKTRASIYSRVWNIMWSAQQQQTKREKIFNKPVKKSYWAY